MCQFLKVHYVEISTQKVSKIKHTLNMFQWIDYLKFQIFQSLHYDAVTDK